MLQSYEVRKRIWRQNLMLTIDFVFGGEDSWIFVAELEESFDTSTGVFGTLTIVAVREG
jgi:hypothetical protein